MKYADFFYIVIGTAGSLGNGNTAGTAGDCPKGFVCLKNGNCGGILNMEKIFFVVALRYDPNICYEHFNSLFISF